MLRFRYNPNHYINEDGEIVDSIAPDRILAQYPNNAEGIAVNVSPERSIIYSQYHNGSNGYVNPVLPMMVDPSTKRYKVYLTEGKYVNYLSKAYYPTVKELYLMVRWKIITTGTTVSYEVSQIKVNNSK